MTSLLLLIAPRDTEAQVPLLASEEAKIVPSALREDFQVMRKALEEGDSGIYRYVSKKGMDRVFNAGMARIDHAMDTLEFYRIVAPVVAAIKCGHTNIHLPEDLQKALDAQVLLFPAEVVVAKGKPYILRNISMQNDRLAGAEILRINGIPANRIINTMKAVFHGDGNTATAGAWRLSHRQNFITSLYTLLGIRSPFELEYRQLHGGKRETIQLQGQTLDVLKDTLRDEFPQQFVATPAADLTFLDRDRIAVLKVSRFNVKLDNTGEESTADFLTKAFEQIRNRHSVSLILDVRDNRGGSDELGKLLFSHLTAERFMYYKDLVVNPAALTYLADDDRSRFTSKLEKWNDGKLHKVVHPNWGIQQPSQPTFAGQVFALMNGGSFSTTCEFLSTLHFHRRATFIGEEVAGAYYGNSSGLEAPVILPHSHLVLGLQMVTYYLAVSGYPHPDRGVMPDYPVEYTIGDLLAGTDKDMVLALNLARQFQSHSPTSER